MSSIVILSFSMDDTDDTVNAYLSHIKQNIKNHGGEIISADVLSEETFNMKLGEAILSKARNAPEAG